MTSKKLHAPENWEYRHFTSKGGANIRYGFAHPPQSSKGTVVITGGYGRHIEYYYEKINNWLDRGYSVYAMDWDGQGGSGRENPDQRLRPSTKSFDRHVEDFHEFVTSIVKPDRNKPAFLSSHSKGGNIMLHYLHEHENDADFPFQAAILGTPLLDINTSHVPRDVFKKAVHKLDNMGFGHLPLPSLPKILVDFNDAVFGRWQTSRDLEREKIHEDYKNKTERFEIGYPTIGWLRAAFNSCDKIREENVLHKIKTPVLILTTENDSLVSVDAQTDAAKKLANGKQVVFENARHGIWYDLDEVQSRLWAEIDNFAHDIDQRFYSNKGLFLQIKSGFRRLFNP